MRILISVCVMMAALVGLPPTLRAQTIPPEALAAEGREAWTDALRLYGALLEREPGRVEIWLRVSDIHARLEQRAKAVEALHGAIRAKADDPELYARLSRAYATADQPRAALAAIQGALALKPEEPSYLKACGELASWSGEYRVAREALEALLRLTPNDTSAMLTLARVLAWDGETDKAVRAYRRYLQSSPDDSIVWLEAARAESWRGNDHGAASLLQSYRLHFGESDAYRRELVSVLTRARRPGQALVVLRPLLSSSASDYDVNVLHALARMEYGDAAAAERAFTRVSLIDRESRISADQGESSQRRETSDLAKQLRNAFGSVLQPSGVAYGDSDGLRSYRLPLSVSFGVGPFARVQAGYEHQELRARAGSGLDAIGTSVDGTGATLNRAWAGLELRPRAPFTVRVQAGRHDSPVREEFAYTAGATLRLGDELRLEYDREHSLMTISPRAVSLGLARDADRVRAGWNPFFVFAVDLDASREVLSDGNERRAIRAAPRFAVVRNQWLNLDLGASAYLFAADLNLEHGYYDPSLYEAYSFTVLPYFKFSENHGLSLFVEAGMQKDDSVSSFEPGGSVAGELSLGIYRAWMLKVNASGTINSRLESGAFRGFSGGIVLVRRF